MARSPKTPPAPPPAAPPAGPAAPATGAPSHGRRATLADVARDAGVDVSTVSRVLNADASVRVAEATRERILQAARGLGYRANVLARALRTARSRTLGMVVPQLDNPVFALAIAGAEKAAWSRGHSLLIAHEHDLPSCESVYENLVNANRVDGLIVASLAPEDDLLRVLEEVALRPRDGEGAILSGRHGGIALNGRALAIDQVRVCRDTLAIADARLRGITAHELACLGDEG